MTKITFDVPYEALGYEPVQMAMSRLASITLMVLIDAKIDSNDLALFRFEYNSNDQSDHGSFDCKVIIRGFESDGVTSDKMEVIAGRLTTTELILARKSSKKQELADRIVSKVQFYARRRFKHMQFIAEQRLKNLPAK